MENNYVVHPGVILKEHLDALSLTQKELSVKIGVSTTIINEIIKGKRGVNASLASKLETVFNLPAKYWLGIQSDYDLAMTEKRVQKTLLGDDLVETGYTAQDIVNRFICYEQASVESDEFYEPSLTNLKLQKLLYFAQKEFIKIGLVLFNTAIKRWEYGPVVPTIYRKYKDSDRIIATPEKNEPLPDEIENRLKAVYLRYNKYATSYLVTLSHKEKSWLNTKPNQTITPEIIRAFL